jgi:molybdate transport system regulatory protein
MPRKSRSVVIRPRIRIMRGEVIVIGPGKVDLLEAIARMGSIRAAAAELGMSYMRAWGLVRTMNQEFREPLVEKSRGGQSHGGAHLTELGRKVVSIYRRMEEAALQAIDPSVDELRSLLK